MLNWILFVVLVVWILDREDERTAPQRRFRLIKSG
jgi:hypothetical protein